MFCAASTRPRSPYALLIFPEDFSASALIDQHAVTLSRPFLERSLAHFSVFAPQAIHGAMSEALWPQVMSPGYHKSFASHLKAPASSVPAKKTFVFFVRDFVILVTVFAFFVCLFVCFSPQFRRRKLFFFFVRFFLNFSRCFCVAFFSSSFICRLTSKRLQC